MVGASAWRGGGHGGRGVGEHDVAGEASGVATGTGEHGGGAVGGGGTVKSGGKGGVERKKSLKKRLKKKTLKKIQAMCGSMSFVSNILKTKLTLYGPNSFFHRFSGHNLR